VFLIEKKNWPTVGESRKAPIAAKNGSIIKLLNIKLKYADRNFSTQKKFIAIVGLGKSDFFHGLLEALDYLKIRFTHFYWRSEVHFSKCSGKII